MSIKISKQPHFVIDIKDSCLFPVFGNRGRRQLHIQYSLTNIGDAPAVSVYCCCYFELQQTTTNDGSIIVPMNFFPDFFHAVEVNKNVNSYLRFEEKELSYLINDLNKSYELNMNRVAHNPSAEPFEDTILVTEIFFLNTTGQWFKLTNRIGIYGLYEVADEIIKLRSKLPDCNNFDDDISDEYLKFWTKYNKLIKKMDEVPPMKLKNNSKYLLKYVNPHLYNSILTTIDQDSVKTELAKYMINKEMTKSIDWSLHNEFNLSSKH